MKDRVVLVMRMHSLHLDKEKIVKSAVKQLAKGGFDEMEPLRLAGSSDLRQDATASNQQPLTTLLNWEVGVSMPSSLAASFPDCRRDDTAALQPPFSKPLGMEMEISLFTSQGDGSEHKGPEINKSLPVSSFFGAPPAISDCLSHALDRWAQALPNPGKGRGLTDNTCQGCRSLFKPTKEEAKEDALD